LMLKLIRSFENPILVPDSQNKWESQACFNPSVWKDPTGFKMVYRALSPKIPYVHNEINVSTIGYAESPDPIHFVGRRQLISPEYDWEKYGCEDPRITKMGEDYYIFYTALGGYPFGPENIKVGVAKTRDLKNIDEKHLVTPFNAKGACLLPEKVKGKYAVLLTVNTDKPPIPSSIGIAYFDKLEDIWDTEKWEKWYSDFESNKIDLLRDSSHQVEVGAVPIKTKHGWLLVYSYTKDYFTPNKKFGIEAVLLDSSNPQRIIARTEEPLLTPKEQYELFGDIPYTIFPSGAVVSGGDLYVYYGAADTVSAVASVNLEALINDMISSSKTPKQINDEQVHLTRYDENPIISPIKSHSWESEYTFNPAAIYLEGETHILYRAQGKSGVSTLGYASVIDGVKLDKRLDEPVYKPRIDLEVDGCEDARITKIGETLYLFYTALKDGMTHIAMSTISVSDFLDKKWKWTQPVIISPTELNDKNACIVSEKIEGKYVIFHRTHHRIWIAEEENLDFSDGRWIQGNILFEPKDDKWYSEKVGIAAPPIKTTDGWLLIFHGLSRSDKKYRLGAMLLDLKNPLKITALLDYPILEPETSYEKSGFRPDTVFSCGAVVIKDELFVYYGAGDTTVAVASVSLAKLLNALKGSPCK
jgi:predicted GH43/DUF377 family glycosyl hydrolase